jgi:hypothetical protein
MDSPEGIWVKMFTGKALLFSFSIENLSFFWNTKSSQKFDFQLNVILLRI